MQKDQITHAALDVLVRTGLDRWNVAEVARVAGCAKGLVHYHHQTKEILLGAVADRLARKRADDRLGALDEGGTNALDRLWSVLAAAAESGETAAWLSLLGHSSATVRRSCQVPAEYLPRMSTAIGVAFALEAIEEPMVRGLNATIDGLELALVSGDGPDRVHEAFHQAWLSVL